MSETNAPLYHRGKYRLAWDRRADGTLRTPFLQVVWYDERAGRNRSRSAGTASIQEAEDVLDRLFLERERGQTVCPTCGRTMEASAGHLVTQAISDYLLDRADVPSIGSIRPRLAHVLTWLIETNRTELTCDKVDDSVIEVFRRWSAAQPVVEGIQNAVTRARAPGTTEASVRSLAAAINFAHRRRDTPFPAGFSALAPSMVSRTPSYRAGIDELAAMFRYCLHPVAPKGVVWSDAMRDRQRLHRRSLLRFLQVSVATWCRPDAAHDLSTKPDRDQWIPAARVVQLNPKGRRQTKKYRPAVPVPVRFAAILNQTDGFVVEVKSVRKAFEAMLNELGFPRARETGVKLVRRSIAQIARKRIGEERWRQGEIMLGHAKASTSDLYALFDPANLGTALQVTDGIISEIEARAPGAFAPPQSALAIGLRIIKGGANA